MLTSKSAQWSTVTLPPSNGVPVARLLAKPSPTDHSFSHHDCLPYYLRTGDKWSKIDYSKHPDHWMKPLEKGPETGLVEIPANWYLGSYFSECFFPYLVVLFQPQDMFREPLLCSNFSNMSYDSRSCL